jgi:hypothetical protein
MKTKTEAKRFICGCSTRNMFADNCTNLKGHGLTEATHTPTPWTKEWLGKCNEPTEVEEANVAFMLKAVNSHDALLSTVKQLVTRLELTIMGREYITKELKKAIAQAEGGK